MKGYGLVQCYFQWTAQRYYNQFYSHKTKLWPTLFTLYVLSVDQAFHVKANTYNEE